MSRDGSFAAVRRGHSYTYFCCKSRAIYAETLGDCYTTHMDQNSLVVTLAFTFILGAGLGFYAAKFIF